MLIAKFKFYSTKNICLYQYYIAPKNKTIYLENYYLYKNKMK